MDLFALNTTHLKPLAERLRPTNLVDFVGQEHIIGDNQLLTKLITQEKIPSLIFWGPPGVGKTTLAHIIAHHTQCCFVSLSAVTSGIKEVKDVIEKARETLQMHSQKTLLFIDEIHRFNKSQQDAFLPHVETGTVTLIGATTENPSFEVIPALLSRCKVVVLNALSEDNLLTIAKRALGKNHREEFMDDDGLGLLVKNAHGDARYLINMVEDLLNLYPHQKTLLVDEIKNSVLKRAALYDKNGEHHYNVISAFIKSLRGSDPNAALYYLARMLNAGEDPLFIARRMVIFASEDVGNANPSAVQVAVACMQSYDFIGAAEGWIPLSQCAVYLAGSPKSNASYAGYKLALQDVKEYGPLDVPLHLRNAPTQLMKNLGYGKDYKYAHSYEGHKVEQQHLPDAIKDKQYYIPTENGHEKKIKEWLEKKLKLPKNDL
jgi:putative ATPase